MATYQVYNFQYKGKYEVLVQGDANTPKYDAKIWRVNDEIVNDGCISLREQT